MIKRYHTSIKGKAFAYAKQLNESETEGVWRVAQRVKDRIIFDLDSEDMNNVKLITDYYSKLFGEISVYKSFKGYHLYSVRKYTNEWDWHYDCARVLYPILETKDILRYLGRVKDWYSDKQKEEFEEKWTKELFLNNVQSTFKDSGLYCGIGDYDILFAIMVILKGYYCIRISKKGDNDIPYRIDINSYNAL